ncbi:hypothetical protein TYRP_009914 [Tyrophagus putrescentiae]|nr:hypothetical protein TYRP_009914 [Tyrophagus putrescentiae]
MLKKSTFVYLALALVFIESTFAQPYIGGAYDIGEGRHGERRGDLGPAGIAGVTIGAVAVCAALIVTIYFCYASTVNSQQQQPGPPPNGANYHNTKYQMANSA